MLNRTRMGFGIRGRITMIVLTALPLAVMGVLVATGALARGNAELPPKLAGLPAPPIYASQEEELKAIEQGKAKYADDLEAQIAEFIASGQSIQALPRIQLNIGIPQDGGLTSVLARAMGRVVLATVIGQHPEQARYIINVLSVDDGFGAREAQTPLLIAQEGGPVWDEGKAYLLEHQASPILVPGRQYLLFLGPERSSRDGKYPEVFGLAHSGSIYEVRNGKTVSDEHAIESGADLSELPLAEALSRVRQALAER